MIFFQLVMFLMVLVHLDVGFNDQLAIFNFFNEEGVCLYHPVSLASLGLLI